MAFVPDPVDVQNYQDAQRVGRVFSLGCLPRGASQRRIESAIREIPGCAGNVTVYWEYFERTSPNQKNLGWCHILCSTLELKNRLRSGLANRELIPNSNIRTRTRRVNLLMVCKFNKCFLKESVLAPTHPSKPSSANSARPPPCRP
ncbi:hypothetical protein F4823DRAFT_580277 [Ustulina deusta]|nr:hypothetical protein F4823DRAFT_580277 [Ustulina deusta]